MPNRITSLSEAPRIDKHSHLKASDMFKLERDELIQQMKWRDLSRDEVRYVEAWKYARLGACTQENFCHGILPDSEIERWLRQVVGLTSSIAIVLKLVGTAYHDFSWLYCFLFSSYQKGFRLFCLANSVSGPICTTCAQPQLWRSPGGDSHTDM